MAARTWGFFKQSSTTFEVTTPMSAPFSFGVLIALTGNNNNTTFASLQSGSGQALFGLAATNFPFASFDQNTLIEDGQAPLGHLIHMHANVPASGNAELWVNGLLTNTASNTPGAEGSTIALDLDNDILVAGLYAHSDVLDDVALGELFKQICHQKDVPNALLPDVGSDPGRLDYVWSVKRRDSRGALQFWLSEGGAATPLALVAAGAAPRVVAYEELPFYAPTTSSEPD